ncbi:hypothetical protein P3H80_12255 [Mycolicibacterium septicum]|uniref:hypothetical protein n=1 Tax=Mycolicibacterium septicum TaxID=98668 RepID=UPI0023E1F508|nr:hypothetical protein [Mycolicibacterium septicum]MDF3338200.1 hypothetical protein [Mycolicibacterium septicum]
MSDLPLTPMLVQYLVGLCCAKWDADAVDVTLGDKVMDSAAEKKRDIDITVTVASPDDGTWAFKAYEVKDEGSALDVAKVEQMCMKFSDMEDITHRAIVSTSGFSASALKKAQKHGVELYHLKPWDRPIEEQFPILAPMKGTPQECFPSRQLLLYWDGCTLNFVAPTAPGLFSVGPDTVCLDEDGNPHAKYDTCNEWANELQMRSTELLFPLEPAVTIMRTFPVPLYSMSGEHAPSWPHTHTMDVMADGVYVEVAGKPCRIDHVTINGALQWRRGEPTLYYVMSHVPDDAAFAGALVTAGQRAGQMQALILTPKSRNLAVEMVQLSEKHLNFINQLKLIGASGSGDD